MVFSNPTLVGICSARIGVTGELYWVSLIGHVRNCERIYIGVEADFIPGIGGIRPVINYALCIVGVSIRAEAACIDWGGWILNVDEMQSPGASACPNAIGEPCIFVDNDVVCAAEASLDSSIKCNRVLPEKIPWQVFESQGIF